MVFLLRCAAGLGPLVTAELSSLIKSQGRTGCHVKSLSPEVIYFRFSEKCELCPSPTAGDMCTCISRFLDGLLSMQSVQNVFGVLYNTSVPNESNDISGAFTQAVVDVGGWRRCLDSWKHWCRMACINTEYANMDSVKLQSEELTFRISLEKSPLIRSNVRSQVIDSAVLLLHKYHEGRWKINLTDYDVDATVFAIPASNESGFHNLFLAVKLGGTKDLQDQWRVPKQALGTDLQPSIAYALTYLADVQPSDKVIADPCCGVGAIPASVINYFARSHSEQHVHIIASDVNEKDAEVASSNLKEVVERVEQVSGVKVSLQVSRQDARELPHDDASIDLIITDLPWGRREGSTRSIRALYPRLVKEFARVLKPGTGRAILFSADYIFLFRTVETFQKYWTARASSPATALREEHPLECHLAGNDVSVQSDSGSDSEPNVEATVVPEEHRDNPKYGTVPKKRRRAGKKKARGRAYGTGAFWKVDVRGLAAKAVMLERADLPFQHPQPRDDESPVTQSRT